MAEDLKQELVLAAAANEALHRQTQETAAMLGLARVQHDAAAAEASATIEQLQAQVKSCLSIHFTT